MNWHRVDSPAAWESYCKALAVQWGLEGVGVVWKGIPAAYPALVASHRTGPATVITAVVQEADARRLLGPQAAAPAGPDPLGGPTIREFCCSVAAHLMTLRRELIRVGIITDERYERSYVGDLATTDRWSAEDRDRFLQGAPRPDDA